MKCKCK